MMSNPALSVIIPTHHRPALLRECLLRLSKQTNADQLEIIVVHDGEDDAETVALFDHSTHYSQLTTHYLAIPKSQQGTARNRGVERATAPIVLFAQDDIFLEPDACEIHVRAHTIPSPPRSPSPAGGGGWGVGEIVVLGNISWDPALDLTPVMQWLDRTGWQFGYRFLERYRHNVIPSNLSPRFTYSSFISLPTAVARAHPFREDISLYGWEDILWGRELRDAGIPLFYEPDAKALHHHPMTLEDSLKRMETIGRSLRTFEKIDPTFDRIPRGYKLMLHRIAALIPTMRGKHERAFLRGFNESAVSW